ncbi:MAG TPA: hypothetical protein VFV94_10500, partial [Polyangiaceae bacterium]|nr:hypothetical protein [Polyangiaceae bacterium]
MRSNARSAHSAPIGAPRPEGGEEKTERTFHPGAASLVAVVITSVACNAIFDITEGASRHSAAGDDDATQAGVSGASPGAGTNGIPKGGKGGITAGGAAGLSMGGSTHGGSSNGGAGGATSAAGGDGTNGGSAGSNQGTGGSAENGGTGAGTNTGGAGGDTSGNGGSRGGTAGAMAGMGGGAGAGPKTFIEAMPIFIWPKCSEDTAVLALTCAYYGDETLSSCPSGGAKQRWTYPIGGTKGTTYRVDVVAFGAVQEHCMTGGTQVVPQSTGAVWLEGGEPAKTDGPVFELHVKNATGTDDAMYYLNAFKQPDVDPQDQLPECDTEAVLMGSMRFL